MTWFLLFTGVVAGFLLVVLVAGLFVPRRHRATVRERVEGPADRVWEALADPAGFPEWRPGVTDVELHATGADGPTRWTETSVTGSMTLEAVEREPPRRLVIRIADADLPFSGTWTFELEPEEGGTSVTVIEDGEIHNPLFRFMAHFILGYEATMRDYLAGLREHVSDEEERPG